MSDLDKVLGRIDDLRDQSIKILSDLVSIPTVNPPGKDYDKMAGYLEDLLSRYGISVKVHEVPRSVVEKYYPDYADHPRYIVIARLGSKGKILHFNGHYDVVPAGQGWSHDPFKPVVEGGKLYGRGSTDMKGGIAAAITTFIAFAEAGVEPPGVLEASFTPDEETGGQTGVLYMLEAGLAKPDYAVVAEPSGLDKIWIGNKGAVWATIEVYGKQAHGSTPWLGVNAFEKMVELAYLMIKELKPRIESKKSKYDYGDPNAAKATINIGGEVSGGAKTNIVPGFYSFSIDRRVIPEETADEAAKEIIDFVEEAKKRIEGLNARVVIRSKFNATVVDPDKPIVVKAKEAAREVLGKEPSTVVCIGGLDTRYFQERGIEAITYGPGKDELAHMADEYVEVDDLPKMAKIYARLAFKLLA
ncbi:MAG: M20 family metallopeptidase [Pyrodictiaceae archaeon]